MGHNGRRTTHSVSGKVEIQERRLKKILQFIKAYSGSGESEVDPDLPLHLHPEAALILKPKYLTEEKLRGIFPPDRTLDFTCTGCGKCCCGGGDVYFSDEELEGVFQFLEIPEEEKRKFRMKFIRLKENGLHVHRSDEDCFFLKENRCTIYPVRPLQCRTFPFWSSNFTSRDSVRRLKKECPGSLKGAGKVYSHGSTVRRTNRTLRNFVDMQESPGQMILL